MLADPALYVFTGAAPPDPAALRSRYERQCAGSPDPGELWSELGAPGPFGGAPRRIRPGDRTGATGGDRLGGRAAVAGPGLCERGGEGPCGTPDFGRRRPDARRPCPPRPRRVGGGGVGGGARADGGVGGRRATVDGQPARAGGPLGPARPDDLVRVSSPHVLTPVGDGQPELVGVGPAFVSYSHQACSISSRGLICRPSEASTCSRRADCHDQDNHSRRCTVPQPRIEHPSTVSARSRRIHSQQALAEALGVGRAAGEALGSPRHAPWPHPDLQCSADSAVGPSMEHVGWPSAGRRAGGSGRTPHSTPPGGASPSCTRPVDSNGPTGSSRR
ncbi:hypothetical protein SMICM304S_01199 [Streptomyces microflavus]